jgi:fucose permease
MEVILLLLIFWIMIGICKFVNVLVDVLVDVLKEIFDTPVSQVIVGLILLGLLISSCVPK